MKQILLFTSLFCMSLLHANVVKDAVKGELSEYRTYPRLQKADNYIAEGKTKEAKALLLKVMEIDPQNEKAANRVVVLCMQDKDFECAKKYVDLVKPPLYRKYYTGYISFQLKEYAKALKAASSIEDPSALKTEEQAFNDKILLRSAIMSNNSEASNTYLDQILHPKYSTVSCPSESLEIISLLFTHKMFDAASKEIDLYLSHCKSQKIPDEKLAVWSDILRKENQFDKEEKIIAYMEDTNLKNEHTLMMYLKSGDEAKAIETMEKIYQADPSDENKVRLVYLYENAHMKDKVTALYSESYELGKNPEDLRKLLYIKKDPQQQYQILEKYYAYEGLSTDERFNFAVSLIEFHQNAHQTEKILPIIDDLGKLENLTGKQKQYVSDLYAQYHQPPVQKAEQQKEKTPTRSVQRKTTRKSYVRYETQTAYDLIEQKRYDEAVVHIKNAIKHEPNNPVRYEQLGNVYYAQGKYELAAKAYKKAIALKPKSGYYESLAYCQMKMKDKEGAIESFKRSIDIVKREEPENIDKIYQLKYSVAELDRRFFGYVTYGVRLDSYDNPGGISPILAANYGGFAAAELHYKPEMFNDYATVYVKVLAGVKDQNIAIRSETWQPSVGIRFQPKKDEKLYFFVEQFFKGGDETRNDTMLRASWELFDGYDFHPSETEYWWKHLYLDGVYYLDSDTYSLYANYEHGYVWKSGYEDAWMPYVCTSAGASNDNGTKETIQRFDVGAGISYFFWRNEREYKSHQYTGRARLEYRHQYAGDPEDDHSLRLMLEFFF